MIIGDSSRPATIYDVARLAGVSHQTVSRLIKGEQNVGVEMRAKIERALAELDYHPNEAARTLTTRRSNVIGALVHDISEVGPSLIIQGASERAREAGYFLEIVPVASGDAAATESSVDLLKSRKYAGLVAVSPSDELLAPVTRGTFRIPVHIAHAAADDTDHSLNDLGVRMLMDHLIGLGHRRFAYLAGPEESLPARKRLAAYQHAIETHRLTDLATLTGDWSARSGYDAVSTVEEVGFTALVAANDQMALGGMLALADRGFAVPRDVSVVGFDDVPEARYYQPPLTTIAQDMKQQGRLAVEDLLRQIDPDAALAPSVPVRPRLEVRRSTAAPPADRGRDRRG